MEHATTPRYATVMAAIRRHAPVLILFSCLINALLLVTAVYMLQVYDRVLASGSLDTLAWLTVAALVAIAVYGVLERSRQVTLGRMGGWLDEMLTAPVVQRAMETRLAGRRDNAGPRDVADLRNFLAGDGIVAFLDAPWSIVFIGFIWLLHPTLGAIATVGALVLFAFALANDLLTRAPQRRATAAARSHNGTAVRVIDSGETIAPLGMTAGILSRWQDRQRDTHEAQRRLAERTTTILSASRAFRLALYVAVLGTGASLVIAGELTAGAMIAASIIMGRALSPVERSISAWRRFVAARDAQRNLAEMFGASDHDSAPVRLPRPRGQLVVENANFAAPSTKDMILRNISFALEPGQACAVIGPSGSGKSSLCRLLVGAWRPYLGHVRLDGADVYAWDSEDLGRHIGYLPQRVDLFPGTVAENIARFGPADSDSVIAAARLAGVHEMVLALPDGYETDVGTNGDRISHGQRQRLGLARALFGDPAFVVLDEPNSNLDSDGDRALAAALAELKARGRTVVLVTHRLVALQNVDKVLVLRAGAVARFGDLDEVQRPRVEAAPRPAQPAGPRTAAPPR